MVGRPDAARDLSQEALVKAIRGLSDFDGRSLIGTWLTRIAINGCLSYLRSKKRSRRVSAAAMHAEPVDPRSGLSGGSEGENAGDGELSPVWSVQWEERRRAVTAALQSLTPEHRAVLVLRDVRGLEYEQIAEVLSVAVGTVKSRLFRARSAMREAVEQIEADRPHAVPAEQGGGETGNETGNETGSEMGDGGGAEIGVVGPADERTRTGNA